VVDDQDREGRLASPVGCRDDVAALDDADRRLLVRWVSEVSGPLVRPPAAERRRRRVLVAATAAAAVLVPWLALLAATLPDRHRDHEWRLAWVGFDGALVLAFVATAWFGWRGRQIVVTAFVVTATLLLCDAWFDVVLSWGGPEQRSAVLTALLGELPFAVFMLTVYHRLLRATATQVWRDRGLPGEPPPLRRLPLLLRADKGERP
jgi:MFS family permease